MKNKTIAIIDFIAAALWLVCVIIDIVNKDFSAKFFIQLGCAILLTISGFVYLKSKKSSSENVNTDDVSKENTK